MSLCLCVCVKQACYHDSPTRAQVYERALGTDRLTPKACIPVWLSGSFIQGVSGSTHHQALMNSQTGRRPRDKEAQERGVLRGGMHKDR